MSEIHDQASDVIAENGIVIIEGPGGVAFAMMPEAAAQTSERLLRAAAQATRQQGEAERRRRGQREVFGPD